MAWARVSTVCAAQIGLAFAFLLHPLAFSPQLEEETYITVQSRPAACPYTRARACAVYQELARARAFTQAGSAAQSRQRNNEQLPRLICILCIHYTYIFF